MAKKTAFVAARNLCSPSPCWQMAIGLASGLLLVQVKELEGSALGRNKIVSYDPIFFHQKHEKQDVSSC